MTDEEVRAALADTGELRWADGEYRLKVKKVDGKDLLDVELTVWNGPKLVSTLKAKLARVRMDREKETMKFYVDEGVFTKNDVEVLYRGQQWDLPAPRQGKRR